MKLVLDKIVAAYLKAQETVGDRLAPNLYSRIYDLIRGMIQRKELPEKITLPSSRTLANALGVSRSTIIKAYEFLKLEGFIDSKTGSGHIIKSIEKKIAKETIHIVSNYPSLSKLGQSFLNNTNLINSIDDKSVSFRPGLPPLDIFPVNQWKSISNLYWKNIKLSNLSYSPATGIYQLKRNIANYLNLSRNIKCDADQVIIVSGSLQSLYLIGTSVIDAGDSVFMENPTFPNVHSIFKGLMSNIQGIGVDKEGILVDDMLASKQKPKLIHVTPSCHYPLGIRMSMERKHALLKYASSTHSLIIENDYEHELNNWYAPQPSLFSLDQEERTIYLGTFNRLLHPSLRIGYMVVPYYLKDTLSALLKHSHRFVPAAIQVVLNKFMEKNYLYTHVKKVAQTVEKRQAFFANTFNKLFGNDGFTIEPSTTLSLQNLVRIPDSIQDKELINLFAKHHIIAHSYNKCFTDTIGEQGLILGNSAIHTPVITSKLQQMYQLFKNK